MTKVNFRTNVLLKSILGKDLITDDNIAVQELVKNSFDAGSLNVLIEFQNIVSKQVAKDYKKHNDSKIIISDLGVGMSEYDLINKWLNIAYSEKKIKKEKFNRTLAGNKGVGRFSCDRLGKLLTIYTKQKNTQYAKLVIDWRKFEQIDDIDYNIQDIQFELENISHDQFELETGIKPIIQGTTLVIESLRDIWNHDKILSLKRQLEKLINPNQSFKAEKFNIHLKVDEFTKIDSTKEAFERVNGIVENKIFEKLNFKVSSIQSKISRDGKKIITILKDKGVTVFSIIEKNPFDLLKDVKTFVYYLNPYSKAYFKRQTGLRSFEFGSISLFINGFRIPPYGDFGDDWLGMENRKGQGRNRYLGSREVVGRIEIKDNQDTLEDEDDEFKIISSRSGVRNNEIFKQLAKSTSPFGYYYKNFRRLERFVVEGIRWDSVKERDLHKLEQKVLNDPDWDESQEEYSIDSLTRNKQILNVIDKLVKSNNDEIIQLKINKTFVSELIEKQKEKTQLEINSIAQEIKQKDLTSVELRSFLRSINISKKDLENFPVEGKEINILKVKQSELEILVKEKEKSKRFAEEEAERLATELELEKDKNTYLLSSKRTMSDDAKGLIHNVKLTSKRSKRNAQNLYDAIKEDRFKKSQALKWLSGIIYNVDKALKISNLITVANFKANSDYQDVNIVKYVTQYFELYSTMYEDNELSFEVIIDEDEIDFIKRISILDLSLVLDDLISNSVKASAKNVQVDFSIVNNDDLCLLFSDDGVGLDQKFANNKEIIFDLGVTTTDGSGIGLNFVTQTLKKMNGSISYDNTKKSLKGASFKIIIKKSY